MTGLRQDVMEEIKVFSLKDFSTNYCNLRNLYCGSEEGCKPVKHDFNNSEACRPGESGLQLVGAVPLYLKKHSEGEFCEEADWIEASWRHKNSHWPRLFVGVPFTPHRGRRLITAAWLPEVERTEVERELLEGLRAISVRTKISVNIGFPTEGEGHTLKDHGFVMRFARQAWWSNRMLQPRWAGIDQFIHAVGAHSIMHSV
eukprot:g19625.t1